MTGWPALAIPALSAAALWLGCAMGDPHPPGDAIHVDERPAAVNAIERLDTIDVQPVVVPPLTELLGHVTPAKDSAFAELPARVSSRKGLFLRTEAHETYIQMYDAAEKDGVILTALSATRPFSHQASIWNRKWKRPQAMGMAPLERARDILKYSSMPGTSRHHWGTDVDIHSLEPSDFDAGEGAKVVAWLRNHAGRFGFVEVYTEDDARPGYQPEAWHWSYLPLSGPFLSAINDANEKGTLPPLEGFEGAFVADSLHVLRDYVNGINATLGK